MVSHVRVQVQQACFHMLLGAHVRDIHCSCIGYGGLQVFVVLNPLIQELVTHSLGKFTYIGTYGVVTSM